MIDFSKYTDSELLHLLKHDNEIAFNTIYDRYSEKLFAIAFHFSKNKFIAEDIVQDIFMSLWDRRHIVEITSLNAYLAAASKFSVLTYIYKDLRRKDNLKNIQDTSTFVLEDILNARFLKDYIVQAIQKLPEKCKTVYLYSREDGLSVREIACLMNIAPKTVENHLFRALKMLRLTLKNLHFDVIIFLILIFF